MNEFYSQLKKTTQLISMMTFCLWKKLDLKCKTIFPISFNNLQEL